MSKDNGDNDFVQVIPINICHTSFSLERTLNVHVLALVVAKYIRKTTLPKILFKKVKTTDKTIFFCNFFLAI